MARWNAQRDGTRRAEWIEDGRLPELIRRHNARHPRDPQTLDGYINHWVLRPFVIAKGNRRGSVEMHAVVPPGNVSHRRAAELSGGSVLNLAEDFSAPLAALGDRIADTIAVPLEPVLAGAIFQPATLRVQVDGRAVAADPRDGFTYDPQGHIVRFHGESKRRAQRAKIEISYEEHL